MTESFAGPVTRAFSTTIRRSLIRGSLRRQILFAVVIINVVLIAVVWAQFLYYEGHRSRSLIELEREDVARKVQKFRDLYIGFLQRGLSPEVGVPRLIRWQGWDEMRYVKILRSDQSRVYINPKGARLLPEDINEGDVRLALIDAFEKGEERAGPGGGTCIPLELVSNRPWGAIYLLPETPPPPDIPGLPFFSLFSTLAAGTVMLILVTYVLLNRLVLSPLEKLVGDARRLARGDYDTETHLLPERRDEVGRLSLAIGHLRKELAEYRNDMTGRVNTALERVKASERGLATAQRLAATGKLAAGLAHEINNPLAGILNMTRRLSRGGLSPEKQTQYLNLIEESLERIKSTLGHLMRSSPRPDIELARVELRSTIEAALALVRHRMVRSGVEVEVHFGDSPLVLLADRGALQQIFLNLFLNATDAMASGGRLTVRAGERDRKIEVRIEDTGEGMSREQMEQAFDLFFTTKPVGEGSGLGLGIVHKLVEDLGGTIHVESEPGVGTEFRLTFPVDSDRETGDTKG